MISSLISLSLFLDFYSPYLYRSSSLSPWSRLLSYLQPEALHLCVCVPLMCVYVQYVCAWVTWHNVGGEIKIAVGEQF